MAAIAATSASATTDTDGDGVPNGRDRCPEIAAHAPSGCPRVARKITIEVARHRVSGEIKRTLSPCAADQRVKVFRVGKRRARIVDRVRTDSEGKWRSAKRFHDAVVYVRAPRKTEPKAGRCTSVRTHSVRT